MSDSDRHHHHHKKSKKHKRDRSRDRSPRGDSDGSRKSEDSSKKDREKEKSVEKSGSVDVKELVPNPNICPKLIKRITKYLQNWNKDPNIDVEKMALRLHGSIPDYEGREFHPFHQEVQTAFEEVMRMAGQPIKPVIIPPPEPVKEKKVVKPIESSDDEAEKSKVEGLPRHGMNQTMTDLYATSNSEKSKEKSEEITVIENGGTKSGGGDRWTTTKPIETTEKKNKDKKSTLKDLTKNATNPAKKRKVQEFVEQRQVEFRNSVKTFNDVGGLDDKLLEFVNIIQVLKINPHSSQRSVLLHGPPGCGKTLLANAIAGELEWPMLELNATDIISGISGQAEANLRGVFEQATDCNQKCVVFIDEIETLAQKKDNSSAARGMDNRIISQLKSCISDLKDSQVLCLGATSNVENLDLNLRAMFYEVSIGIPNETARLKILEKLTVAMKTEQLDLPVLSRLTPSYVGRDFEALCFEASKAAFSRHIREKYVADHQDLSLRVKILKGGDDEKDHDFSNLNIIMDDFKEAIKTIQPAAKREGFATVPDVTWSDVGALNQVRKEIEVRILDRVNNPEKAGAYNLQAPTGILLCGPPGCGKTLVAKAMANEAGINFISVKGPELLNMYVGESERAVRQVFQRAKNSAPCVIFFDEIDALCPKRSSGSDHSGSNRVVTQMLTEMDGYGSRNGVYIIAATNREEIVDPAIKRPGRLETTIYVGLPNLSEREEILKAITRNGTRPTFAPDVDFEHIAQHTDQYSGADLKALTTKASEIAFREDLNIPQSVPQVWRKHFDQALRIIRPSVSGFYKQKDDKMKQKSSNIMGLDAEMQISNGLSDSYGIEAKRKSQIQNLYSQLLNEKAIEKRLRFKPDMEVTIKDGKYRERTSGVVIKHELKSVFIKTQDDEELCIKYDELDQVLPDNPGDKAKLLTYINDDDSAQIFANGYEDHIFEIMGNDQDVEENFIVKDLENQEMSSVNMENLCRIRV